MLPRRLSALGAAPSYDIANLKKNRIRQILKSHSKGLYVFCRRKDGVPVYVGQSANLPQRLGLNHRSTNKNQAPVTKALKNKHSLGSMKKAREILYRDYVVRLISEPDTVMRAFLEIYAAWGWDTEFNSFEEH